MWAEVPNFEKQMTTTRTYRVFLGEGVRSNGIVAMMYQFNFFGYSGRYSFEVFNDDYQQIPLRSVAERGKKSVAWLEEDVLRIASPVKGRAH